MIATPAIQTFDPRSVRGLPANGRRLVERWFTACASRMSEVFLGLGIEATLSFESLESHSATDALATLPDPDCAAVFAVSRAAFTSVLSMSPKALLLLLQGMIGVRAAEWPAEKPLSAIEQSLAEMLFERMRREWSDAWPQRDPVPLVYRQFVSRTARSRVFDPALRLLMATFQVETSCGSEKMRWLAGLDDVELLANPEMPISAAKPASASRVADIAPLVPMSLSVELGRAQLSVNDAESLQCGDVLVLDQRVRNPLLARVAGQPKYQGRPGRIGSRLCFAIESLVED